MRAVFPLHGELLGITRLASYLHSITNVRRSWSEKTSVSPGLQCAFLRLRQCPGPPPTPGRQNECHRSSVPPDSDLPVVVRTANATGCCSGPQTAGSRCSSRFRSLPPHSPPLVDSSAWTARPPCPPALLVAVFRLAATDRSSLAPLLGPRGFVPVAFPQELSAQQRLRSPAACPSAHSRRWDSAGAAVRPAE